MSDTSPEPVAVQIKWRGPYPPALAANQFFLQIQSDSNGKADGFVLTFGHVTGPVVLGTAEQQAQYVDAEGGLFIEPVGRFAITDANLLSLQNLIIEMRSRAAMMQSQSGGES